MRTAMENITRADPNRSWTVREVAEFNKVGGIAPVIVGGARTVADAVEAWVDGTDLDGLNLGCAVMPETFEDIARYLVPELQRRGRFKTAYRPGTLRHKLFGRDRLGDDHPAAATRWRG